MSLTGGDCLAVWKFDRFGRSPHLLATVTGLKDRGVAFHSLTEQTDTTPQSELLFHIVGALPQFERAPIQKRVQAGLAVVCRRPVARGLGTAFRRTPHRAGST